MTAETGGSDNGVMSTSGDNLSINDTNNTKGDVNSDGKITDDDIDLLDQWLVRLIGDKELDLKNADVNYDGKVNTQDLVELNRLCDTVKKTTSKQQIDEDSEILSAINTEDNSFKLSVDITAAGDAETLLSADESGYSNAIKSDMVVGVVPELEYEEGYAVDEVTLNFDIKDDVTINNDGKYASVSDDFKGVRKFNVFKYFEDIDMLLPIETNYTEDNTITTTVDELGTYCLVDMEKWFKTLGVDPTELTSASAEASSFSMMGTPAATEVQSDSESTASSSDVEFDKISNRKIDIVLNLFLRSNSSDLIAEQARELGNSIFDSCDDSCSVNIYVVDYKGTPLAVPETDKIYAENKAELNAIFNNGVTKRTTTKKPLLENFITGFLNYHPLRNDADKYYVGIESDTVESNNLELIKQRMDTEKIHTIVVTNENMDAHASLADSENVSGMYCNQIVNYCTPIWEFIIDSLKIKYTALVPTGWKEIELNKPISSDYEEIAEKIRLGEETREKYKGKYADTDEDGLLDLEEIRYLVVDKIFGKDIRVTWDKKGNVVLPTLAQVMQMKSGLSYIEEGIKELPLEYFGDFRILPIKSNPAEKDTDGDEFEDGEETLAERMKFSSVTIDDHLLDDSGSIDGNNPTITQDDLDKMHINEENEDSYTTQVSSEDKNSPLKNELKFTRTRKKDISDAKFTLTPSRNSDFAITITGTEELNLGEGATADNYNSTVRVFYKKGFIKKEKRQVDPVEIRLSNYGRNITYVFALEKDVEYSIKVNNPTNEHEGEYDIHVSEDNWVYAPDGGVFTLDNKCIVLSEKIPDVSPNDELDREFTGTYIWIRDYTKIYMSNSYLEKWLTQAKSYSKPDELTTNAYKTHLRDSILLQFFDIKEVLHINSNEAVEICNSLATGCTYAGAALVLLAPEAPFALGAIISVAGGITTTIPFCISNDEYDDFEKTLEQAINDFNTKNISLSLEMYGHQLDVYKENVVEWSSWDNGLYIPKYEFGYHGTVVPFTDSPVFYDDLI